jgi:hypothetical protein
MRALTSDDTTRSLKGMNPDISSERKLRSGGGGVVLLFLLCGLSVCFGFAQNNENNRKFYDVACCAVLSSQKKISTHASHRFLAGNWRNVVERGVGTFPFLLVPVSPGGRRWACFGGVGRLVVAPTPLKYRVKKLLQDNCPEHVLIELDDKTIQRITVQIALYL